MSSKYFKDDARIQAVQATCNMNKTWANQTEQARYDALCKWHEICSHWANSHKNIVQESLSHQEPNPWRDHFYGQLKNALNYVRRKTIKSQRK